MSLKGSISLKCRRWAFSVSSSKLTVHVSVCSSNLLKDKCCSDRWSVRYIWRLRLKKERYFNRRCASGHNTQCFTAIGGEKARVLQSATARWFCLSADHQVGTWWSLALKRCAPNSLNRGPEPVPAALGQRPGTFRTDKHIHWRLRSI